MTCSVVPGQNTHNMVPHVAAYRAVMWQTGSPVPPWQPAGLISAVLPSSAAVLFVSSKQGIGRKRTKAHLTRRVWVTPEVTKYSGTFRMPVGCKCERLARLVAWLPACLGP